MNALKAKSISRISLITVTNKKEIKTTEFQTYHLVKNQFLVVDSVMISLQLDTTRLCFLLLLFRSSIHQQLGY